MGILSKQERTCSEATRALDYDHDNKIIIMLQVLLSDCDTSSTGVSNNL